MALAHYSRDAPVPRGFVAQTIGRITGLLWLPLSRNSIEPREPQFDKNTPALIRINARVTTGTAKLETERS